MRMKFIIACLVLIPWILIENHPCPAADHKDGLSYTRLAVNQNGASYFVDEQQAWNVWPSNLAMITLTQESDSVKFFRAKPGWEMRELHYAPRRQYLLVLHGTIQIQASSGEIRQFAPGSILLVEDTYGEGHRTKNAGDEDLLLAWVGIQREVR